MANRRFESQFNYSFHAMPVSIDCNFVVDSANGNGLGIRSLKGGGVKSVFMHTSASPLAGNPNPGAGIIMLQLQDPYKYLYAVDAGFVSPLTGSALTAVTNHLIYVIVSLGTATLAQWQAKGLPQGITPAVGVTFIATATGTIGGSAAVKVQTNTGISAIEVIGNSILSLAPSNTSKNGGGIIYLQCLAATSAGVTTLVPTAPPDESVMAIKLLLSNSSVTIQGD